MFTPSPIDSAGFFLFFLTVSLVELLLPVLGILAVTYVGNSLSKTNGAVKTIAAAIVLVAVIMFLFTVISPIPLTSRLIERTFPLSINMFSSTYFIILAVSFIAGTLLPYLKKKKAKRK